MNWNSGAAGTIRTTLGRNRLATGFRGPLTKPDVLQPSATEMARGDSTGSLNEPIEISDDTDMEDESDGGMLINVDQHSDDDGAVDVSSDDGSMEDGEMAESDSATSSPTSGRPVENDAHMQLQGDIHRPLVLDSHPTPTRPRIKGPNVRLSDLNPDELEKQVKYTLFHLPRDQIDLNRLVTCTACLQDGHLDEMCPEKVCIHCGLKNRHSSRCCPTHQRCRKCRARGHTAESCPSKLKESSVPCDYCGSVFHVEDKCTRRFFLPVVPPDENTSVKLWISCCVCASNTHLVGDCSAVRSDQATRWSLKSLDPYQITNMSLQTGARRMEQQAMNRGMRPEGLKIKGRADQHQRGQPPGPHSSQEDDEEDFRLHPPSRGNNAPRGGPMRVNLSNSYRPDPTPRDARYDRFDAPTDDPRNNRGRSDWYQTDSFGRDQRPRSRSPAPERGPHHGYQSSHSNYGPSSSHYSADDRYRPRSPSSRRRSPDIDSYRPPTASSNNDPYRSRDPYPPSSSRGYHASNPSSHFQSDMWRPPLPPEPIPTGPSLQIPVRKGSNPALGQGYVRGAPGQQLVTSIERGRGGGQAKKVTAKWQSNK